MSVAKIGTPLGSVKAAIFADTVNGTDGSVSWTYQIAASKLEYLAAGEQRIETFDVTVKEKHGGASNETVTVTLCPRTAVVAPFFTARRTTGLTRSRTLKVTGPACAVLPTAS